VNKPLEITGAHLLMLAIGLSLGRLLYYAFISPEPSLEVALKSVYDTCWTIVWVYLFSKFWGAK
jgi:hypothetical protein